MTIVRFFTTKHNVAFSKVRSLKASSVFFWLSCAVTAFGFTNLFSVQGWCVLAGIVLLGLSVFFSGEICWSWGGWLLLLFCSFYNLGLFIGGIWTFNSLVYYFAFPLVLYLFAKTARNSNSAISKKHIVYYLCSCAFGYGVCAMLTILATIAYSGIRLSQGQPLHSFFGSQIISRTGLSVQLILPFSICFGVVFASIYKRNLRQYAPFSILVLLLCVWASNGVGNRAFVMVALLMVILVLLIFLGKIKNRKAKVAVIAVVSLATFSIFLLSLGLVPPFLLKIPVFARFAEEGSSSQRISLLVRFFTTFFRYPFGGLNTIVGYSHNVVLDVYTYGGAIPFVIFCFMLYKMIVGFVYQIRRREKDAAALLSYFMVIGILLLGLFEPVFQGNEFLLGFFGLAFGLSDVAFGIPKTRMRL